MTVLTSTEQLTVYSQPLPFALLRPAPTPARVGPDYQQITDSPDQVIEYLRALPPGDVVAVDYETRGTDPTLPDTYPVALGFAAGHFSCSLHTLRAIALVEQFLLEQRIPVIGHNIYFDGQWSYHRLGAHWNWVSCTYGAYRQVATEGWKGQRWGLKNAMVDVLQWADSNTDQLDAWLVANGFHNHSMKPNHGEMWRAPTDILCKYNVLDCEATYLFYVQHLRPILHRFPALQEYHEGPWMNLILLLIEQRLRGIAIDVPGLENAIVELQSRIAGVDTKWSSAPTVREGTALFEAQKLGEFELTEPARYRKQKERKEPIRYTKKGAQSKVWERWVELVRQPPVESLNWIKWQERRASIIRRELPKYLFNVRSGDHLRWFFYEYLGCTVSELTETGQPSVESDVLSSLSPEGALLAERAGYVKELEYLVDYRERMTTEQRDTLHPGFRIPGTVTGRLSGTSPNLQQCPKTSLTMSLFVPRPGYVFVDIDFSALEPHVGAELSRDENLLKLYGPAAPPVQDIYLFYGAQMPGSIGDAIRASGYDPQRPTKQSIGHAKQVCKRERAIMKALILSDTYGSGTKKKWRILQKQGVDMPMSEVQLLHDSLQQAKQGVLDYSQELEDAVRADGYFLSGLGHPIGVHDSKFKDVWNTQCQSTGHAILVVYIDILTQALNESGIEWYPSIMDWHDATMIECREQDAPIVIDIMNQCMHILNAWLGGSVPLKGEPEIGSTLAEVKHPEA